VVNRVVVVGAVLVAVLAAGCTNVKELQAQVADLNSQLADAQAERDRIQDEAQALRQQNQAMSERLNLAQQSLGEMEALRRKLGGDVSLSVKGGFITMELPDKVLYKSGEAKLTEKGKETLRRVASALNTEFAGEMVRVEGHTDSDPIRRTKDLYKSNWELSAARALEVVHFLTEQADVDPARIHAAAFGQHQPVAPNTSAANKQANRRVAVVILPSSK